jgi:hypothetical protein
MPEDPLESVYAYTERAYIRLQAGDMIMRCLDEGNPAPIQQMVEGLVLAGPQNIEVMKEILAEVGQRKSQLEDDVNQLLNEMVNGFQRCGLSLPANRSPRSLVRMSSSTLIKLMSEQNITDEKLQSDSSEILHNSKELVKGINTHIRLVEEIERHLQDWIWGLACQSTRTDSQIS